MARDGLRGHRGARRGVGNTLGGACRGGHYYILIGGICDGQNAAVYDDAWLQGGIRRVVDYPAGGPGLPNCDQTPMDTSVARGHERARQVVQEAYAENPDASFTIVGYSQGAIVANKVLNDIADENLGVDKSRFSAKLFADPMQPVGPQGVGVSAAAPDGAGLPSELGVTVHSEQDARTSPADAQGSWAVMLVRWGALPT